MSRARKRPCSICHHWFYPDPRVGTRQRACGQPECQSARRVQTQASWRARNPDYFLARRIQSRASTPQAPEPLRLPPPLAQLPWDVAQDEFGVKGADFLGVMSNLLLRAAQDQRSSQAADSQILPPTLPHPVAQDQSPPAPD